MESIERSACAARPTGAHAMDRRYSIQPVIRREGKDEEEKRLLAAYEAGRRGSEAGRRGSESGRRASEVGRRASEAGRRASESGRRASEAGRRTSEAGRRGSEATRRESEAGRRDSEAGRKGSAAAIVFNKTHSWVKRSNLTPDSIRPFPETRASWDESMRRRDSQKGVGLKGIQLRKGFSDDRKNYISIFQTEGARRMSRPSAVAAATQPPAYFSPNARLCKWETVNLTSSTDLERVAKVETIMEDSSDTTCDESGTDTNDESSAPTARPAAASGARPKTYRRLLLRKLPSREDSGIDLNPLVTVDAASPRQVSSGESSFEGKGAAPIAVAEDILQEESEEYVQIVESDGTEEVIVLQDDWQSEGLNESYTEIEIEADSGDLPVSEDIKAPSLEAVKEERVFINKNLAKVFGQEDSKAPKRDSISLPVERPEESRSIPEERRASVVPFINVPKDQNNYEKFLDIIGERKGKSGGGGSDTEVNLMAGESSAETFVSALRVGEPSGGEDGVSISRARSCEMLRPRKDESRPLWERRHRPSQFSPGTRPILLNMESIDDWAVSARTMSKSSTIVETSGMYICKDRDRGDGGGRGELDHLDVGGGGASGDESGGGGGGLTRSGSKLRKPTNLWGVTRRISVKRKKVTEKREVEVELQPLSHQHHEPQQQMPPPPQQQQQLLQQQQQQQPEVSPR